MFDADFFDVETDAEYWISGRHGDRRDTTHTTIEPRMDEDERAACQPSCRGFCRPRAGMTFTLMVPRVFGSVRLVTDGSRARSLAASPGAAAPSVPGLFTTPESEPYQSALTTSFQQQERVEDRRKAEPQTGAERGIAP
jgi:hypothetical protein